MSILIAVTKNTLQDVLCNPVLMFIEGLKLGCSKIVLKLVIMVIEKETNNQKGLQTPSGVWLSLKATPLVQINNLIFGNLISASVFGYIKPCVSLFIKLAGV